LIWAEAAEAVDHTTARIIQEVIHIQAVPDLLQDLHTDHLPVLLTVLQDHLHHITPVRVIIGAAAAVTPVADAAMRVVSAAA
jgi:hypothetical protein